MAFYVSRSVPHFCTSRSRPASSKNVPLASASQPRIADLSRHFSKPSSPQATLPRRIEVIRPSYKPRSDIEELAIYQTIHCERLYFAL